MDYPFDSLAFAATLVGIGVATGMLTGLTGASGMSVLISGLLLAGIDIREVIALTFLVTLVNSAASIGPYWRKGHVDPALVMKVSLPAVAMVFVGHRLGSFVPGAWLKWTLVAALFAAGVKFSGWPAEPEETTGGYRPPPSGLLGPFGLGIGLLMGLLGGGGGVFIGLFLILVCGMPTKRAVGNSIFIMGMAAAPGLMLHGFGGTTPWSFGLLILAASIPASLAGGLLANRIQSETIKRVLGAYLLIVSTGLLVRALW